jgi:hypothetical protein
MARLAVFRNGVPWAEVELVPPAIEVGAGPGSGLRLMGAGVRPFHLVLRHRGGRWHATARAGTIEVEGRGAVRETVLRPGVRLAIGPYRIALAAEAVPADRAAPGGDERTRPLAADAGDAALRRPPILRWLDGGRQRHVVPLRAGDAVLGRGRECDVRVEDPSVSARHARIRVGSDGSALIEDLGSLNGTFLVGRRVFAAEIHPGTEIRLGAVELECLDPEGGAEPRAPVFPPGLAAALAAARSAARLREPCVLLGETGTGKEVLARLIHREGPRRSGPFVPVNCGALPRDLAESVLFGHRRGAFTGAVEPHRGAFERADRGTLFLDEVGEMPPETQAKLLRVLEDGEVWAVGAERPATVDVRVLAATHRPLLSAAQVGAFRLDLWHRLSALTVRIPPLRHRPDDIEPIAEALLAGLADQIGPRTLEPEAFEALRLHPWPGNVRELRNVLLRAAVASSGARIGVEPIRRALDEGGIEAPAPPRDRPIHFESIVRAHGGNLAAAARSLGLPRTTFREMLARERIRPNAAPSGPEPWKPQVAPAGLAAEPRDA